MRARTWTRWHKVRDELDVEVKRGGVTVGGADEVDVSLHCSTWREACELYDALGQPAIGEPTMMSAGDWMAIVRVEAPALLGIKVFPPASFRTDDDAIGAWHTAITAYDRGENVDAVMQAEHGEAVRYGSR